MFTSRAEFRLTLRADNADQRLTSFGRDHGLVGHQRWSAFSARRDALESARNRLTAMTVQTRALAGLGLQINPDKPARSGLDALGLVDADFSHLVALDPSLSDIPPAIAAQLRRDALYQPYVERQDRDISAMARDEALRIPDEIDYGTLPGLSSELRLKLAHTRPATLGQAARIDGMTPAALVLLAGRIRRDRRASA
jgi:tRNA uridine 5-carboxymethylaminomethyl modification enzyme